MANIGIIGSGNVGANCAFFIAEKGVSDVVLYDIQDGMSTGKALDMMEAAPVRGYRTKISGTDRIEDVLRSDILIVTAGAVRQPGMKREDLFEANRAVVSEIAQKIGSQPQKSEYKVIVVTEPVDMMTALFVKESGLARERVMGLGGTLDATRLRYLIAHELGVAMEDVSATVVGRHSSSMIPLADYCTVAGVPISRLLSADKIEALFEATRTAGDLIVKMAQRANAYYGPSAVACDLAEAINHNSGRILPVSLVLNGEYGVSGVAMSLPAVIGKNGVEQVLKPKLTGEQQKQFTATADELRLVIDVA